MQQLDSYTCWVTLTKRRQVHQRLMLNTRNILICVLYSCHNILPQELGRLSTAGLIKLQYIRYLAM